MTGVTLIRLHSCAVDVTTLGPGPAVALWVQGCGLRCGECTTPDSWSRTAGSQAEPGDIASWMNTTSLLHLTISGGEPFDQATALCEIIDAARTERDWIVTCYSGYDRTEIEVSPGPQALLARLDLLIDGPYIAARHAPLLWRGSTNQRIHRMTDRVRLPADAHAGVDLRMDDSGAFSFVGVPVQRRFRSQFETRMDVQLRTSPAMPAQFPFPTKES